MRTTEGVWGRVKPARGKRQRRRLGSEFEEIVEDDQGVLDPNRARIVRVESIVARCRRAAGDKIPQDDDRITDRQGTIRVGVATAERRQNEFITKTHDVRGRQVARKGIGDLHVYLAFAWRSHHADCLPVDQLGGSRWNPTELNTYPLTETVAENEYLLPPTRQTTIG